MKLPFQPDVYITYIIPTFTHRTFGWIWFRRSLLYKCTSKSLSWLGFLSIFILLFSLKIIYWGVVFFLMSWFEICLFPFQGDDYVIRLSNVLVGFKKLNLSWIRIGLMIWSVRVTVSWLVFWYTCLSEYVLKTSSSSSATIRFALAHCQCQATIRPGMRIDWFIYLKRLGVGGGVQVWKLSSLSGFTPFNFA